MNYISNFLLVRRELFQTVGGLRSEFNGSQDYDLILRMVERTKRIAHIPRILYHARVPPASSAVAANAGAERNRAARRAVSEYLKRNKIHASVEKRNGEGRWRVRYEINDQPKVTIIIPVGCRTELLRTCLESLAAKTAYRHFEVMVADNSKATDVQQLLASMSAAEKPIIYLDYRNHPFNFSAINNAAVRQASGPLILFLNDDTEIVSDEWLAALVEHGQRPEVGVVGAKLIYPFGLIQHAGMVLGIDGTSGHAFKYLPAESNFYFDFPQVVRNCSAVTGACMLTKRSLFLELGGFNEVEFGLAFQDPDYCLRVREAGLLIVYTPYATLVHHESASRGFAAKPSEISYMKAKWASVISHDPYYSPNLTRKSEDYSPQL